LMYNQEAMTYSIILILHIVGACMAGLAALSTAFVIGREQQRSYRSSAIILGALGGFQVVSGVLLAFVSPQITILSLCNNIALYLSTWFVLETLLFLRMNKISVPFPFTPALSPVIASLVLMVAALSYGF
jgi:heme A synthase